MRVTVRLFARLRDIAGAPELAREVGPGATIASVWRDLTREFPGLAPYERTISSALNADYARMDRLRGKFRSSLLACVKYFLSENASFDIRNSVGRADRDKIAIIARLWVRA